MSISVIELCKAERDKLLALEEGHFCELKSTGVQPAKLSRSIAAFTNSEGGELYVGISQDNTRKNFWAGFPFQESANGHLQCFESLFPLGDGYTYSFLASAIDSGLVLKIEIDKSRGVVKASDGRVYVRRGAQNLPYESDEELTRLRRNKGLTSFETEPVCADPEVIISSSVITQFMSEVVPSAEPGAWLRKQQVIHSDKPTVSGIILFAEEPQALLPKRSGIKVYRYLTTAEEGTRDTLSGVPVSVEGHAYQLIHEAVRVAAEIIESVRVNSHDGLESAKYPITALHEIITNAVLHRDYSIADDIHIRIFDNRVEVVSPGTLPAHITPENILEERFARNPAIDRQID
jgi:ATP-dependent DNA helicase RecG